MKYSRASASTQALLATSILSLLSATSAADILVSCDKVPCPRNEYNRDQCTVGNTTLVSIGVASFAVPSSISSSPFTWAIGIQSVDTPEVKSDTTLGDSIERSYFLGTPQGTDLSKSAPNGACAIFFEGISEFIHFPGVNNETSIGTCADALTAGCATALIQQAQSEATKLGGSKDKCEALQTALASAPPAACSLALSKESWGLVAVRDLTKLKPTRGKNDDCLPSTGKDYIISHAASFRKPTPLFWRKGREIALGITPVMTVFFGDSSKPEVGLTCMKPLHGSGGMVMDTDDKDGAAVSGKEVSVVLAVLALGAFSFLGF